MSDSIDLLEAVGRDASLRRMPPDQLAAALRDAGASEALATATVERDARSLDVEFGVRAMHCAQGVQIPYREDEDDQGEREDEDDESHVPRDPGSH